MARDQRLTTTAEGILASLVSVRRLLAVIVVLAVLGCVLALRVTSLATAQERQAAATKEVADVVKSCTTPTGTCARQVAARNKAEAEARAATLNETLHAITAQVESGIASQRAEQAAHARSLLAAVKDALRRLDAAEGDRAQLQEALDDARRQIALLAAELRRARDAEPTSAAPPPTPEPDLCVSLGPLGELLGC